MPAPAMTTIFFLRRKVLSKRSSCASAASSRLSRSRCCVVRGLGAASLRRLGGGAPSVRTWISWLSGSLRGEALPDWVAVELGDGYRVVTSMLAVSAAVAVAAGDSDGDLDSTERGEEGEEGEGVWERSERGDVGGEVWWRAGDAIAREWLPVWQAIDALRGLVR